MRNGDSAGMRTTLESSRRELEDLAARHRSNVEELAATQKALSDEQGEAGRRELALREELEAERSAHSETQAMLAGAAADIEAARAALEASALREMEARDFARAGDGSRIESERRAEESAARAAAP